MKYDIVYQFTKKGNLLDFFRQKADKMNIATAERYDYWHEYYAREREIALYAMIRYQDVPNERTKLICKIKCPINPLPIKGEFELPGMSALVRFLAEKGWVFEQKIPLHMFE